MHKHEVLVYQEIAEKGMVVALKPSTPGLITPRLVEDIRRLQDQLVEKYIRSPWEGIFYVIWHMEHSYNTPWHGLDYQYILSCLRSNKEGQFEKYIHDMFDLLFLVHVDLGLPVVNCAILDRTTSGLSSEFFYLMDICFVQDSSASVIQAVDAAGVNASPVFTSQVYQNKHYYLLPQLNLDMMREKMERVVPYAIVQQSLEQDRVIFETLKEITVETIYSYVRHKPKVLDRLGEMQRKKVHTFEGSSGPISSNSLFRTDKKPCHFSSAEEQTLQPVEAILPKRNATNL
jgi:hypothetical protein